MIRCFGSGGDDEGRSHLHRPELGSTKLIRGLVTEAATGFQSRRGLVPCFWGPWCCRLPAVGGAMGRSSPSRAAVSPFETVRFHAPPRRLGVLPVSRSRR